MSEGVSSQFLHLRWRGGNRNMALMMPHSWEEDEHVRDGLGVSKLRLLVTHSWTERSECAAVNADLDATKEEYRFQIFVSVAVSSPCPQRHVLTHEGSQGRYGLVAHQPRVACHASG